MGYLVATRMLLSRKSGQRPSWDSQAWRRILSGLLPILLLNLFFSLNSLATLSWSLHLLLYLLFFNSFDLASAKRLIITLLPYMAFFQLVLGAAQVLLGHTLQGPFYYLGERALSVSSPNVATGEIFHQLALRSYGTFSHPNVLAGWLVVAFLILVTLSHSRKNLLFAGLLTGTGILLTQSRSAALAFFGLVIPFRLIRRWRPRLLYFATLLFVASYLLFTSILSRPVDTSLADRQSLQSLSLKISQHYPLFGTGANASITAQSSLPLAKSLGIVGLQPDHNSLALFLSWFGLIGTLAILQLTQLLYFSKRLSHPARIWRNVRSQIVAGLPLLPLLLLDHYFLTSPQGLFILLLYIRSNISPDLGSSMR